MHRRSFARLACPRRASSALGVLAAVSLALARCAPATVGPATGGPAALPFSGAAPTATAAPGAPVALLAPLTGGNAGIGQALVQATQLAFAAPGSPPLDVRDTGGTAAGAAAAAQAAIAAGDRAILGPLTAGETAAVAPAASAARVPVLAFTNDAAQARPGIWTLGITPRQQVRRLVGIANAQGKSRIAAMLPPGAFGAAMGTALTEAAATAGLPPPIVRSDDGSDPGIQSALRSLSDYANRRGPIDAKIREARAKQNAEGRREAAELAKTPIPPPPFDTLLLAETGDKLAWAASFLAYYDIAPPQVQLMGPSLWAIPSARGGANLTGAWYAAPDPAARAGYVSDYQAKYGSPPPGPADLAFDAASVLRVTAPDGYAAASLCRAEGYAGVDGVLGLLPDGQVRRGLAVFAVAPGGASIIDPAPSSLAAPGI